MYPLVLTFVSFLLHRCLCSETTSRTLLIWRLWGWTATSWAIRGSPRTSSTYPPCWTCNYPTISSPPFRCSALTWSTCTSTTTASRVSRLCSAIPRGLRIFERWQISMCLTYQTICGESFLMFWSIFAPCQMTPCCIQHYYSAKIAHLRVRCS